MRGWADFTKDMVLVDDVAVSPADPRYGDSVTVRCRISLPLSAAVAAVRCLYTVDLSTAANPDFSRGEVSMNRDSADFWTSASRIPLAYNGITGASLLIKFRLAGAYGESPVYPFAIRGAPDLRFTPTALAPVWAGDSLRLAFAVTNAGLSLIHI